MVIGYKSRSKVYFVKWMYGYLIVTIPAELSFYYYDTICKGSSSYGRVSVLREILRAIIARNSISIPSQKRYLPDL